MPELIRLQTSDFEFSVWANDISQCAKAYHTTVMNRHNLMPDLNSRAASIESLVTTASTQVAFPSSWLLRFEPEVNVVDIKMECSGKNEKGNRFEPENLLAGIADFKKCAEINLSSPIFFENTHYVFEWVFFGAVTEAYLAHRSQKLNEAFRFIPEIEKARGLAPARLTGSINTGNDVGWLRLPLSFVLDGKTHTQYIAFEVLPTKMVLHQDLLVMYREIDAIYPLWRFNLVEKTEQGTAIGKERGYFPLIWLANFAALRARFEKGLSIICAAPHSRLQPVVGRSKAAKLKGRLNHKLTQQIKRDYANAQYDKRYRIEKKTLSVDTPENRFIKMVVKKTKRQLAEFEAKLRLSNQAPENQRLSESFLSELHSWQQPLQQLLGHDFLKEVGVYTGLSYESLVLQQKTGYSEVYRIWQELKFYLDVLGNQSSISMKSVAEIYEVWCFLCLKQILEQNLGFMLVENGVAKLSQNKFFEYQMRDGFAGAFCFKRVDGVTARLVHEPRFTKKGESIRSYLVNQEPDIVLEVTIPKTGKQDDEQQFIWLFDAKYRIKTDPNLFANSSIGNKQTDYVPDDAINQMHRYRDALIRLSETNAGLPGNKATGKIVKKSRPVLGAFALYPGFFDQTKTQNPYAAGIEEVGIGAFALLPSQTERDCSGRLWLLEFLESKIDTVTNAQTGQSNEIIYPTMSMGERLHLQEAARIPYVGMRQVLYPDLIMTVAINGLRGGGAVQWYHLPQSVFLQRFKQHVAEEIRYLAVASISDAKGSTQRIDKLWPVKRVMVLPLHAITEEQDSLTPESGDPHYLFELGKPLTLQSPITNVSSWTAKSTMKLTTLSRLQAATRFSELEEVYAEALV